MWIRKHWCLSVVCVLVLALVPACGGSTKKSGTPSTTASSPTSSTTAPTPAFWPAVWPWVAGNQRFRDPVGAARSFATAYLHMTAPVVGGFQQGDSRSGEVPIRASARGPVTTVIVRQLGNDGTWWVLGAATDNIRLTAPAALATITSPVAVRGTSTAFEATVNLSIRQDDEPAPLTESSVMGGSNGQMGPFSASISYPRPTSGAGSIVMYTISAADGHVAEASVIRVRFASGPSSTTAPTTTGAAAALSRFLAAHPDAVVHSAPMAGGATQVAIVGLEPDAQHRAIVVVSLSGGTATQVARLTLPPPNFDFVRGRTVQAADVTGDGAPDALVTVAAADTVPGVVVSHDGGTWRLVPRSSNAADVYFAREATINNGRLETTRNDCRPSCAQGHTTTVVWRYDRGLGRFVAA